VIRSLLDTDFYKVLMLQFIWKHYPKTRVSFALFNRTSSVRLADMFATREIPLVQHQQTGRPSRNTPQFMTRVLSSLVLVGRTESECRHVSCTHRRCPVPRDIESTGKLLGSPVKGYL
jgi:hypothetical protein